MRVHMRNERLGGPPNNGEREVTEDERMREKKRSFVEWVERFEARKYPALPPRSEWAYQSTYEPSEEERQSWEAMRERWQDEADR